MRIWRVCSASLLAVLFACANATAQEWETGKAGITMGYPAAIGFIWHIADSVAIRPEFTFSTSGFDGSVSTDTTNLSTGVSALFYLASHDHVRGYLSPRFTYARGSTQSSSGDLPAGSFTSNTYGIIGSVGVQYAPIRKFSVFAEVGAGYTRSTESFDVGLDITSHGSGMRTGVGVIFYP